MIFDSKEMDTPVDDVNGEEKPQDLGDEGIKSIQGPEQTVNPLPNNIKNEIYRIQSMPVEDRTEASGRLFSSNRELLHPNTTILRNGKGVLISDSDGNEYTIMYKE